MKSLLGFGFALSVVFTPIVGAQTRVVVTGEDSNRNSVERTSEIFRRVTSQLQESMSRAGYKVIDEDMLGVKLGFSFNSRRPKTELIETLMVANETEDATVQSRLAVVYAIFPQVKSLSFTKKLEVRIRGDIYDLKTMSPLANFEYKPRKAYTIPKSYSQCDAFCVEEMLGENAREVAREMGDVLAKKLDIAVAKVGGSSSSGPYGEAAASSSMTMPVTYNLELIRFEPPEAIQFKRDFESFEDIDGVKVISRTQSSRKLSFETPSDFGLIEEYVFEVLMGLGIEVSNMRIEMSGTDIVVENLN